MTGASQKPTLPVAGRQDRRALRRRQVGSNARKLKRRARSSASIFLHFRPLPLHELGRRVNAAKLQDVVADGRLKQHREVATRRNRNEDFPDGHAQDIFRLLVQRQALRLVRPRAIEMHDQPQIHLRAHRSLAEYRADIEHAQAPDLQEILQYRRAAAFERGHRDARDVDDIVRDEPMAAADQFQCELAFAGARVSRYEHAESEHVHAYPVVLHRFRERFAEIATQTLDDLRAGHVGGEHRRARGLGRLEQTHVRGRPFGDDDGYRVDREQIAEHLEQFGLLERGEGGYLVVAEDMEAVGMDEMEMAYERRDPGAVAQHLCELGQDAEVLLGGLLRYQEQEHEADGLAVGCVERNRLCEAHEGAYRFFEPLDPAVRNGDSLPQPRRAETLAGEQAVEHQAPRHPLVVLEQEPGLLEHAFLARHIQVQKDVRRGQELRNEVHRGLGDPAGRNRARADRKGVEFYTN